MTYKLSLITILAFISIRAWCLTCEETFLAYVRAEEPLLGKERIEPQDPLLKFLVGEIRQLGNWSQFPQISFHQLRGFQKLQTGGNGNGGIYLSVYGKNKVVVKVFNENARANELGLLREARVLMELNKLNHGVEFFGVTELPGGQKAIVIEYVDGANVSLHPRSQREASEQVSINQETKNDIIKTGNALAYLGYKMTLDMQFIISKDGRAKLIDPEFFYLKRPRQLPINLPSHWPMSPVESANSIAAGLKLKEGQPAVQGLILPGE